MPPLPPTSTLFPYTTLFRSKVDFDAHGGHLLLVRHPQHVPLVRAGRGRDRKSTRLNSSHRTTSYAVFCLKKKTPCAVQPCMVPPSPPIPVPHRVKVRPDDHA